jgi:nitrite reductase (cytochrome c-552)
VFERQKVVQELLADSAAALGAANAADAGQSATYQRALAAHRKAHVLWENLIVSENSMGFHNYAEVMASMDDAERLAREALAAAAETTP